MNAAPVEVCRLLPANIPIGGVSDAVGLDGSGHGGLFVVSAPRRFSLASLRGGGGGGNNLRLSNHSKGGAVADLGKSVTTSKETNWDGDFPIKVVSGGDFQVKVASGGGGYGTPSILKPNKKGVAFAMDSKGRVHKETFKYQQQRTKSEVRDCWYTSEEFKQFRADCKKEAISQQKTAYRENFAAVYEACKKGNFKTVTKQRAYVSAASCRGLEAIVYQPLQADRKNLLVTVIKTQRSLPETLCRDKQEEAIANASRFLSKQARQLARVLGSGDAAVVMANDRLAASKQATGENSNKLPQEFALPALSS
jgi:hypothetical protein